jgi:extracellular factor (EF) 3-hydroxypalmitic acid methyl ester biosynthesis protein
MINTIIAFEKSLKDLKEKQSIDKTDEIKIQYFFEEIENKAEHLDSSEKAEVVRLIKQRIHPLLKYSEFFRRAYDKPLGFAGDYLTILMLTNTQQYIGDTDYEKTINKIAIENGPSQGHKNRITIIEQQIAALASENNNIKILSIGAGPAIELKGLFSTQSATNIEITLLDNNIETIEYIKKTYKSNSNITIQTMQASVKDILKSNILPSNEYNMIYCTGLFDYLSTRLCKALLQKMHAATIIGGNLLISNLNINTPYKYRMELLADWHIIYRSPDELKNLSSREHELFFDQTKTNIFLKIKNV